MNVVLMLLLGLVWPGSMLLVIVALWALEGWLFGDMWSTDVHHFIFMGIVIVVGVVWWVGLWIAVEILGVLFG